MLFSRYCYGIFISHYIIRAFYQESIVNYLTSIGHYSMFWFTVVILASCSLLGVLIYHLVEKPVGKFFKS